MGGGWRVLTIFPLTFPIILVYTGNDRQSRPSAPFLINDSPSDRGPMGTWMLGFLAGKFKRSTQRSVSGSIESGEFHVSSKQAGGRHGDGDGHARRARRGVDLGGAPRGPRRGRPGHALRRGHLRHADRRGARRASTCRGTSAATRPGGRATAGTRRSRWRPRRRPSGTPACSTAGRSTGRRFGVYLGSGEGQADFPRFVDLVRRSADGGRVDTRPVHGPGDRAAPPAPRGRAGAGDARRAPGGRLRRRGPELRPASRPARPAPRRSARRRS